MGLGDWRSFEPYPNVIAPLTSLFLGLPEPYIHSCSGDLSGGSKSTQIDGSCITPFSYKVKPFDYLAVQALLKMGRGGWRNFEPSAEALMAFVSQPLSPHLVAIGHIAGAAL